METSSFPWDSRDEENLSLLFLEHLDHFLLNDEFLLLLQIARLEIKWLRLKCNTAAVLSFRRFPLLFLFLEKWLKFL